MLSCLLFLTVGFLIRDPCYSYRWLEHFLDDKNILRSIAFAKQKQNNPSRFAWFNWIFMRELEKIKDGVAKCLLTL